MGKGPSYSEQEIKFILDNYKKLGKVKVAEYLGRSPAGIKRMYYLMTRDKREKEILSKLQYPNKLEVGEKYRIIIPAEQRGSGVKHRMFTGTVIQVTEKFTVFQSQNYKECFLNWDLERATIWGKVEPERYRAALMRHLCEYLRDPESIDKESGYPHLWHS